MTDSSTMGQDTFVLMPTRRTFVQGLSGIIDFSSLQTKYVISQTEREADARAIAADWQAVGKDIQIAYVWGKQQAAK